MSSTVGSPAMSWRITTPVIPASRMPFRPWPVAYQSPGSLGVAGAPADAAHHPVAALVEPGHRLLQSHRAKALRVGEQCPHQLLGLERPLARGPERAGRRAEPGPARLHLVGVEPVAQMAVLALPRASRSQLARLRLVGCDPRDTLAPDADVYAPRLP